MATKYITPTETAQLIRAALKEAFPTSKFSVKTSKYAGGASVSVSWTDGPRAQDVEAVATKFAGAYFDGMTDYQGGKVHSFRGETVHFGANYVFCYRTVSDGFVAKVRQAYAELDCHERFAMIEKFNGLRNHHHNKAAERFSLEDPDLFDLGPQLAGEVFRNMASNVPAVEPRPSRTAAAVTLERTY